MPGISLVTKGFLAPPAQVELVVQSGSGGAGLKREEELPKPLIKVLKVNIDEGTKKPLTKESLKVKSVKLLLD